MQDAFVKTCHALSSLRGESACDTWLYRISSNLAKYLLGIAGRRSVVGNEKRAGGRGGESLDIAA